MTGAATRVSDEELDSSRFCRVELFRLLSSSEEGGAETAKEAR
jgi:hypothetical protein